MAARPIRNLFYILRENNNFYYDNDKEVVNLFNKKWKKGNSYEHCKSEAECVILNFLERSDKLLIKYYLTDDTKYLFKSKYYKDLAERTAVNWGVTITKEHIEKACQYRWSLFNKTKD